MVAAGHGVVWWDFDATLVSRPMMWAEVALTLLERHAPGHHVSFETMAELVSAGMPWHRPDRRAPRLGDCRCVVGRSQPSIGEIFGALGHPSAATAPALAALREDILDADRYVLFDDVIPALERSKAAGWRNLIVSNPIPELAGLVDGLDLTRHFDAIVSSGVVGYEKPHRKLFEAALRHVRPGETVWMIGDNPDADCRPACELGMNAVLVRGPRRRDGLRVKLRACWRLWT